MADQRLRSYGKDSEEVRLRPYAPVLQRLALLHHDAWRQRPPLGVYEAVRGSVAHGLHLRQEPHHDVRHRRHLSRAAARVWPGAAGRVGGAAKRGEAGGVEGGLGEEGLPVQEELYRVVAAVLRVLGKLYQPLPCAPGGARSPYLTQGLRLF